MSRTSLFAGTSHVPEYLTGDTLEDLLSKLMRHEIMHS